MSKFKRATYPNRAEYDERVNVLKGINAEEKAKFADNLKQYYEMPWDFDGRLKQIQEEYPSLGACASLCVGLNFTLGNRVNEEKNIFDVMVNGESNIIKDIMVNTLNKDKKFTAQEVKEKLEVEGLSDRLDIIKGSIYKIKRYFMENNNIRDIRGGSWIVDYLNNEYIELFLGDTTENGLIKECLIYSGGGNILIMAPKGKGREVCEKLESKFEEVGLTIMCAFTFLETTAYNLLYKYPEVRKVLDRKLQNYSKGKIHNLDPKRIRVSNIQRKKGGMLAIESHPEKRGNCDLCHMRDGVYEIREAEDKVACPSCDMKHQVGEVTKDEYFNEYKRVIQPLIGELAEERLTAPKSAKSIDQIQDKNGMVAVIYGDGNNMGGAVNEIKNIYEMMYFSYKTDEITKQSVYAAVFEVLKKDEYFEIIAVGGDDIFIIVPAESAPLISEKIINKFDRAFDKEITMSVGVCLGKSTTPIAAMFKIAHDNLDKAKTITRSEGKKVMEGSIDITEIRGGQTVLNDKEYKGIFPLGYSQFAEAIKQIGNMKDSKMRLYDYDYASQIMPQEEFNLYFDYKEAQAMKNKYRDKGVREYLKLILQEDISMNMYLQNNSPWSDLLLLMKYRRG